MTNLINSIQTLNALIDLLNTDYGTITFTHSAEIMKGKTGLPVNSGMIGKWLRGNGYMEPTGKEQIATAKALAEGILYEVEETYGGKKRKQCRLSIKGHLLLMEKIYEVYPKEKVS